MQNANEGSSCFLLADDFVFLTECENFHSPLTPCFCGDFFTLLAVHAEHLAKVFNAGTNSISNVFRTVGSSEESECHTRNANSIMAPTKRVSKFFGCAVRRLYRRSGSN